MGTLGSKSPVNGILVRRLKDFFWRNRLGLLLTAAFFFYWFNFSTDSPHFLQQAFDLRLTWLLSALLIGLSPLVAFWALLYLARRLILNDFPDGNAHLFEPPIKRWRIVASWCVLLIGTAVLIFVFFRPAIFLPLFRRNHLLIFCVTSVIITALLALGLFIGGDSEEFMDGFKTFPTLSPVMCFGAPATWKDTLIKFGLSTTNVRIPATLLIVSGFLFIFAVILFWIGKSRKKKAVDSVGAQGLFGPDGFLIKQTAKKEAGFFLTSAILTFIGLPTFFTAVLELARWIIRA
jgi:hypothetical protein